MILFVNVGITNARWATYQRYRLPVQDRLDIFKYSLASLASIDRWSKVVIYCELDRDFKHRRDEIEGFARSVFTAPEFHHRRNARQKEWQASLEPLRNEADDLVWFTCNDDHVFVDYDLRCLDDMIAALKNRDRKYISCYFSHFPEMVRNSVTSNTVQLYENYFSFEHPDVDSIQILPKDVLFSWWFDHNYGNAWMPRTDTWGGTWVNTETMKVCIPFRELCRHFDGYGHVNVDPARCPPLAIPDGFFENDIKIKYLTESGEPGWVHVNPMKKSYAAVEDGGADYRCVLADLPLFWQKRIKTVHVEESFDPEAVIRGRNDAVWELINADRRSEQCVPAKESVKIFMR